MKQQKFHQFVGKAHKWVGLILGLQVLAWTAGGVVMSWLPIEEVRGMHKVTPRAPAAIDSETNLIGFKALSKMTEQEIARLSYENLLGEPIVKITSLEGDTEIRNAKSGELLSPISADLASKIAKADYALNSPVSAVIEQHESNIDYHGVLPVWRVNFDDEEQTSLYVSTTEARVVARRSDVWRLYDFFWMLHIMDYEERDDANNLLLVCFSISAALFTITGLLLIFFRFYRRDFNFLLGRRKST